MVALDLDAIVAASDADADLSPVDRAQPWVDALDLLVRSARDEGGLTDAGAAALAAKLATLTTERRRAQRLLDANIEVRARPLPVRFAVAGLGRSGTTVLQRLLSCDPEVSFLPTWQAFHPVPSVAGVDSDHDPRRLATLALVEEMRRTRPESFAIHPLDADAPEEEVFLLQHSFASMLFPLTCPMPSYSAWLNDADHRDAYRFALDLIRLNEWNAGLEPRPRVMKSPQYLLDLDVVLDLLPDAVVARTHRDPADLVGSYCSTYANARRRNVVDVDLVALGQERLAQLEAMTAKAAAVRASHPGAGRVIDVAYADVVRRPLDVIERLHEAAGFTVSDDARRAIESWLDRNPQHKGGRHEYDLADYGLDADDIRARFAALGERPADWEGGR
jgi:hypothetical protein